MTLAASHSIRSHGPPHQRRDVSAIRVTPTVRLIPSMPARDDQKTETEPESRNMSRRSDDRFHKVRAEKAHTYFAMQTILCQRDRPEDRVTTTVIANRPDAISRTADRNLPNEPNFATLVGFLRNEPSAETANGFLPNEPNDGDARRISAERTQFSNGRSNPAERTHLH
jgi:hypothetical protein